MSLDTRFASYYYYPKIPCGLYKIITTRGEEVYAQNFNFQRASGAKMRREIDKEPRGDLCLGMHWSRERG